MKQIAGSFQAAGDRRRQTDSGIAQVSEPLYRWTDPTRRITKATGVWAWRSSGRPIAIMAIELYPRMAGGLAP